MPKRKLATEAEIQAQIAADPDDFELTEEMAKTAKPFAEAFPDLAASIRRGRGRQKAPTKVSVTLRLEQDVIDHFKKGGPGWQTRIGETLKKAARRH